MIQILNTKTNSKIKIAVTYVMKPEKKVKENVKLLVNK